MIVLLSQGNVVWLGLSSVIFTWKYSPFVQQMKCLIKRVISLTGCSATFWLLECFQMCKTHKSHRNPTLLLKIWITLLTKSRPVDTETHFCGKRVKICWQSQDLECLILCQRASKLMSGRHHSLVDEIPSCGQFGESLAFTLTCCVWRLNLIICWAKLTGCR